MSERRCAPSEKTASSISSRSRATSTSIVAVVVDDAVDDRVQGRHRAERELLGLVLESLADPGQGADLAAPDGEDEVLADEDHHLAGLDVGRGLDVAQRLEDDEELLP